MVEDGFPTVLQVGLVGRFLRSSWQSSCLVLLGQFEQD